MSETPTTLSAMDLVDHHGRPVEDPFASNERTAVYFMRTVHCSPCRQHVVDLDQHAEQLGRSDTGVLVVVPDGTEAAATFHGEIDPSFPIATSATMHDAVGLQEKVFGKIRQSGVVLVDRTGTVLYSHKATLPPRSLKMNELLAAVENAAAARA